MLSKSYAVIVERYAWSGTAYSWASDPSKDPHSYMVLDAGLPQPDFVICIETSFSEVMQRGGIAPSLFFDIDFQQNLRKCSADPRIWKGVNVLVHETQMNRWASQKSLICRFQGECLLRSQSKPWYYLWENHDICASCSFQVSPQQPVFRCFRCVKLNHYVCLMENPHLRKYPSVSRPEQTGLPAGSPDIELRDPYLNPLEEIVLETGSLPCAFHVLNMDMIVVQEIRPVSSVKGLSVHSIAILVRSMADHSEIKLLL